MTSNLELWGRCTTPCYRQGLGLASAAMKTTRAFLSASLLGVALFSLQGCGQGEYRIPNVPPVVKEKPEEDVLNLDETKSSDSSSKSDSDDSAAEKPEKSDKK